MTTATIPTARAPVTEDDLLRLQDDPAIEFVGGQILEKPVSIETSEIEAIILRILGNEAARTGAVRVFGPSMGYRCYPNEPMKFRKPDVSAVRSDRLTGIAPKEGFMPIPADLVVEVISPHDLAADVDAKTLDYLMNGFGLVWLVYPDTPSVEVCHRDGSSVRLKGDDEIDGGHALPGFKCRVADFFPPLRG